MAKLHLIAGHGDGDPGACANGYSEADLVRRLCERIKALGGDAVEYLDPSKDWYKTGGISTYPFPAGAQVLECHLDSAGSASAKGGHVIVKAGGGTDACDEALAAKVAAMFPGRSQTIVGRDDLANVNRAASRNISYRLCEFCFISNPQDVAKFAGDIDAVARMVLGVFDIEAKGGAVEGWVKDEKGWWYRNADGSYPACAWKQVDGSWFWFDARGYMVENNWILYKGRWCWLKEGGYAARSECLLIRGNWYAFDDNCYMLEGSVPLDSRGAMVL